MSFLMTINDNYIFGDMFEYPTILCLLSTLVISIIFYIREIQRGSSVSKKRLSHIMLFAWSGSIFTTAAGLFGAAPYGGFIARRGIFNSMIDDGVRGLFSVAMVYALILVTPSKYKKYTAYSFLVLLLVAIPLHVYLQKTHYFRCCLPPHGAQYAKGVPCKQCVW